MYLGIRVCCSPLETFRHEHTVVQTKKLDLYDALLHGCAAKQAHL